MNICQQCGACCACYRVSFHWYEASDAHAQNVPLDLTQRVDGFRIAMKRHPGAFGACIALSGEIGARVACLIYDRRPSTCRDFKVSWEDGSCNPQCDKARHRMGLGPIRPPGPALSSFDTANPLPGSSSG